MPQQTTTIAPTTLRRSPRLQHPDYSPKTPIPIPINPRIRSSNSRKTSNSKSSKNSDKGVTNLQKSANGSKRTARLSCKVDKFEGCRRSPRFCNEVNSTIKHHLSFDGNIRCGNKRNGKLISLENDKAIVVDHPVTPIRVWEKKKNGNDYDNETSNSWVESSERRITRSCSKLVGSKVEGGKISQNKKSGRKISKLKACELNPRKINSSMQSSVVRMNCNKVKAKRGGDSCKGGKSGARGISCDSHSRRVTRGGRQGSRNARKDDHDKDCEMSDTCREVVGNLERRITRSASKQGSRNARKNDHDKGYEMSDKRREVVGNLERRINRSASKQVGDGNDLKCRTLERRSTCVAAKEGASKGGKARRGTGVKEKETHGCVELEIDKFEKDGSDALPLVHKQEKGERNKLDSVVDTKLIGVKRKRQQVGVQGKDHGWMREQELALHKAYFTAKPSPDFWKKVAKQVPGKSAQECFDKVHSDNQTPLCKKPSRARKQNSPGFELFDTVKTKSKKTCQTKCKSHTGRKNVRQLLQKYCHLNQDSEADLFTILEPSVKPSVEAFNLTPEHLMRSPESSSKKCLSRFSDKTESPLASPPVLKKVKNMGLHEKYIDQLHTREHKRKVAFSRCMKSAQNQKAGSDNSAHLTDIIKAAKEALVTDAKEVINKYRYSQANIMDALSDSEEFLSSDNEDESLL